MACSRPKSMYEVCGMVTWWWWYDVGHCVACCRASRNCLGCSMQDKCLEFRTWWLDDDNKLMQGTMWHVAIEFIVGVIWCRPLWWGSWLDVENGKAMMICGLQQVGNMMNMVSFGFVEFCKYHIMCFMLGNVMKFLVGLHVLGLTYERKSVERKCKASLTKQCLVYGKVTMVWHGVVKNGNYCL